MLFVTRSLASGDAGVDNKLFFGPNTPMLFRDAKTMTGAILPPLRHCMWQTPDIA